MIRSIKKHQKAKSFLKVAGEQFCESAFDFHRSHCWLYTQWGLSFPRTSRLFVRASLWFVLLGLLIKRCISGSIVLLHTIASQQTRYLYNRLKIYLCTCLANKVSQKQDTGVIN
ncbi:hypothetical protein GOP47_0022004 [Adiantum capillus-veneris]|uniref:Uncharacterized protein n=1 Tax=Adiantum capillus-veneris TaxID=13818 RepID=A0A9D4Z7F8_ADICA|nr:hypothetical protein GOP47_0022004 [Adiantum capillus-veneris]